MKDHEYTSPEDLRAQDRADNCLAKLTWQTRELAIAAAAYSAYQYGDGSDRPSPYRCKHCGLWHLARNYDRKER